MLRRAPFFIKLDEVIRPLNLLKKIKEINMIQLLVRSMPAFATCAIFHVRFRACSSQTPRQAV